MEHTEDQKKAIVDFCAWVIGNYECIIKGEEGDILDIGCDFLSRND